MFLCLNKSNCTVSLRGIKTALCPRRKLWKLTGEKEHKKGEGIYRTRFRVGLQEVQQQYLTETFKDMETLQSFVEKSKENLNVLQSAAGEMDLIRRKDPRSTSETWINYLCCSGPWSKDGEEQSCLCCCCSCICCFSGTWPKDGEELEEKNKCCPCCSWSKLKDDGEQSCLCCCSSCVCSCGPCLCCCGPCLCCCGPRSKVKPEDGEEQEKGCCCGPRSKVKPEDGEEKKSCCCCGPWSKVKPEDGEEQEKKNKCGSCTTLEGIEKKLYKRLNEALKNIQQQLTELELPLLTIERLAMTSEWVFERDLQEQVDFRGVDLRAVRRVLSVVKAVSPWVIVFKQDQIFRPAATAQVLTIAQDTLEIPLETIELLQLRLQAFISALKNICRPLQDSALTELHLNQLQVRLSEELSQEPSQEPSEEQAGQMLSLVQELQEIRDNEDSRLVFLLGDEAQTFTEELREREPQINKCLTEVLECAEKLEPTCCLRTAGEERGCCCSCSMRAAWRSFCRCMIAAFLCFCRFMIATWQCLCRCSMRAAWRSFCRCMTAAWRSFCRCMIAVWWCFSRIIRAGGGGLSCLVAMAASVTSLVGLLEKSLTLEVSKKLLLSGLILSSISLFVNLLTMIIDKWVNKCQKLKGDDICEQLKGHMKVLQRCLNSATLSPPEKIPEEDQTLAGGKIGFYLLKFGLKIVDIIADFYTYEVNDIRLAHGAWSVLTNSVVLVWDLGTFIYLVCKKGKPPVGAQWLKVRAALWRADMKDWKKVCKSLERGQPRAERIKQLLGPNPESEWV